MNTYQSPYVEGQALGAEAINAERDAPSEANPLVMSQADARISGCTKTASDCLHKTTKLARELNHGTVSAAHLVLAMTLIPNANGQFDGKVDIDKAFRASMLALMDIERGSPVNGALPSLSAEFKTIVTLAQELARKREQEVSVDDLLNAFDRLPADSSAAQLIRGEPRNSPSFDTREAMEQLAQHISLQFQEIRRQIDAIRFDAAGSEVARLKHYLETRDGGLEQQIREGFNDVMGRLAPELPPKPPRPSGEPTANSSNRIWDMIFGDATKAEPRPTPSPEPKDQPASQVRWTPV